MESETQKSISEYIENLDRFPEELKKLRRWVCWKSIPHSNPKKKNIKKPISPITGYGASSTDSKTWVSFDRALNYLIENVETQSLSGLMFAIDKDDPYSGIDLDNCVTSKGKATSWAVDIIKQINSYTEFSQSKTGYHILIRGKLPEGRRRKGDLEMYDSGRFFVCTGLKLESLPVEVCNREIEIARFHSESFAEEIQKAKEAEERERNRKPVEATDIDDQKLVEIMTGAKNGAKFLKLWGGDWGENHSSSDLALCDILAFYCQGDFDKIDRFFKMSGLYREKWDRDNYKKSTIRLAIDSCVDFFDPNRNRLDPETKTEDPPEGFDVKFVLKCLHNDEFGDARLFSHYQKKHFCYDCSAKRWYYFKNYWIEDKTLLIKGDIETVIVDTYAKLAGHFGKMIATEKGKQKGKTEIDTKIEARVKALDGKKTTVYSRIAKLRQVRRINAIKEIVQTGHFLGITGEQWDRNPWLLGTKNGVIDLKDGSFRKQDPEDYLRKVAPVDWKGLDEPCERWIQFQKDVYFEKDQDEMIEFKQRLLGQSISGEKPEHLIPIIWGEEGRNGKETEFEIIREVLGTLAGPISKDVIMSSKTPSRGAAEPELYDLWGLRIGWLSETGENEHFNVSRVKFLTGGGTISCRPLHGNIVNFPPSHTLFVFSNHKPHAPANDPALWERMLLIEYPIHFCDNPIKENDRKKDKGMKAKLKKELPGILAWLVNGCLKWQIDGLMIPEKVKQDTKDYRDEEDVIKRFIDDCCTVSIDKDDEVLWTVGAKDVYAAYKSWSNECNLKPLGSPNFSKRFGKVFKSKRKNYGKIYLGVALKEELVEDRSEETTERRDLYGGRY